MFCKSKAALFILLGSFCFAGGSYYKVVNIADNDTLSIRQSASATFKKIGELQSYDTGIIINKCKKNGSTTWCSIDFLPDDIMFFERDLSSMHKGAWVNKKYLKPASNILYSQAFQYKKTEIYLKWSGLLLMMYSMYENIPATLPKKLESFYLMMWALLQRNARK